MSAIYIELLKTELNAQLLIRLSFNYALVLQKNIYKWLFFIHVKLNREVSITLTSSLQKHKNELKLFKTLLSSLQGKLDLSVTSAVGKYRARDNLAQFSEWNVEINRMILAATVCCIVHFLIVFAASLVF